MPITTSAMLWWMLRCSDSRLDLALKSFFNFSCRSAMILKWLFSQYRVFFNRKRGMRVIPNPYDDDLMITSPKSRKKNRKTYEIRRKAGWTKLGTKRETNRTGREGRVNGAQRNRKRNGQGENAGRKWATQRMGQRRWASEARQNGKRNGQKANVERQAGDAAGKGTD